MFSDDNGNSTVDVFTVQNCVEQNRRVADDRSSQPFSHLGAVSSQQSQDRGNLYGVQFDISKTQADRVTR